MILVWRIPKLCVKCFWIRKWFRWKGVLLQFSFGKDAIFQRVSESRLCRCLSLNFLLLMFRMLKILMFRLREWVFWKCLTAIVRSSLAIEMIPILEIKANCPDSQEWRPLSSFPFVLHSRVPAEETQESHLARKPEWESSLHLHLTQIAARLEKRHRN